MAISERVHYFRSLHVMTMKKPKQLAEILEMSPQVLAVPDIDSNTGLMHTLFSLENIYSLKVAEIDGEVCLRVNVRQSKEAAELNKMLCSWQQAAYMLEKGTITVKEYKMIQKVHQT